MIRGLAPVLLLLFAAGGCAAPADDVQSATAAPAPAAAAPSAEPSVAALATPFAAAYARINEIRAARGLGPVTPDRRLIAAARRHARDMVQNDFMGHVGSDGSNSGLRADAAGYGWRLIAENVAAGPGNAQEVIDMWMRSPGHRHNLLTRGAIHAGLFHVARDGTTARATYRNYWVLLLAAPLP